MIKITCKICGERYSGIDGHTCKPLGAQTEKKAVKDVPQHKTQAVEHPPKFDKVAYMREYMRKYRARIKKAQK